MELSEWLFFYEEIISDFGYAKGEDDASARALDGLIKKPALSRLDGLIKGKSVNLYGAGPSLGNLAGIPEGVNIVSDGTTTFLLEQGVVPDVVVTDLDGRIDDIIEAEEKGGLIVVHAHGDNQAFIRNYTHLFNNPLGTTQGRPFGNLLNFGGFTDGDRALCLAEHFNPEKITLYGMDFNDPPGRYSCTTDVDMKMRKLKWAKRIVDFVIQHSPVEIEFGGLSVEG